MAGLTFTIWDIDGAAITIDDVISYELSMDDGVPCHGLRLYFTHSGTLPELYTIRVHNNGDCIFNGYIDTQRETVDRDGAICFVYARSSACLLVDSRAKPYTYNKPCAGALYALNARDLGFTCSLPDIFCDSEYTVLSGKSRYAAINDFVFGMTGRSIVVTVDDCITLASDGARRSVENADIISAVRVINRGGTLCSIDYRTSDSRDYTHHLKSRYLERRGIVTRSNRDLGTLPQWQRKYVLHNQLVAAARDYHTLELRLAGIWQGAPGDIVNCDRHSTGIDGEMVVSSIRYCMDKQGTTTHLTLRKSIDMEEIDYVAE